MQRPVLVTSFDVVAGSVQDPLHFTSHHIERCRSPLLLCLFVDLRSRSRRGAETGGDAVPEEGNRSEVGRAETPEVASHADLGDKRVTNSKTITLDGHAV